MRMYDFFMDGPRAPEIKNILFSLQTIQYVVPVHSGVRPVLLRSVRCSDRSDDGVLWRRSQLRARRHTMGARTLSGVTRA